MSRILSIVVSCAIFCIAGLLRAEAGIPHGVMLIADEQDADATTGITIARGHAEISIEKRTILGSADVIELNPVSNHIEFKGHAVLTVGSARYESDAVRCTLDFYSCAPVTGDQSAPPPLKPAEVVPAVINPR